jgi:HK97 family phage major capsid protein
MKNYAMKNPWLFAAIGLSLIGFLLLVIGNPLGMLLLPAAVTPEDVAKSVEDLAREVKERLSEIGGLKSDLAEARKELEAKHAGNEKGMDSIKKAVDDMLTNYNNLKGSFESFEQKMQAHSRTPEREKTWGEQFVEGDGYKNATNRSGMRGTISAEIKSVTSTAAGGLIRSARETEITTLLRERRVVRDLLRTVPVNTSSVDYAVQSTRTNAAAPVAEAAAKPYSDYAWTSATVVVRTLAHLAKITRQAMDDAPRLMGEIDAEMRYGLGYVEERQFLYGSGVGQNLAGIIPHATPYAKPVGFVDAKGTYVDVLRLAMLQGSLALLPADGIVLSEGDWAIIELTKTDDGAYLFANPQGNVQARMWGLPVVATPAMTAGDFLTGNFQMGATVYDRMGVEVLISTENVDDFEKNLATMRAEERVAIAVKRPGAFIKGTFAAARTSLLT